MREKAEQIKESLLKDIENVSKLQDLVDIKAKYVGKSGVITELTKNMKDLSVEEKKEVGMIANVLKNEANEIIQNKESEINTAILNEKLQKVSMTKPVSITKLTYDDKSELLVPSFGTKNTVAYGSVEYDRREIKDRKFNTPFKRWSKAPWENYIIF